MNESQLKRIVIGCVLVSAGIMAPTVIADTEFETGDLPTNLVVGHFAGETFLAYQPLRSQEIFLRWESRPDDVIALARAPSGFELEGMWADSRAGSAAILIEFANADSNDRELRLLRARATGWTESSRIASSNDLAYDFALAPDGTAYTLSHGGAWNPFTRSIMSERDGVWSRVATRVGIMALGESMTVDPAGIPHVCYGQLGEVIDWRADGGTTVIHRGDVGEFRTCSIHAAADGSAIAVTSPIPLFGESGCDDPDPDCPQSSSKFTIHRRDTGGEWTSQATDVPAWTVAKFVEMDSGAQVLVTDTRSAEMIAYTVSRGGLEVRFERDVGTWDAARWPGESPRYAFAYAFRVGFVTE